MKEFTYKISDPVGIHARPAGMLSKECKKYESTVTIYNGNNSAKATALMALMGLSIKQGDAVRVTVEGADEDKAAPELETYFKANL